LLQHTLNLGILAHVDAGKTTLTERLLYAAGVIDELGSVDDGNTQTDTLALERQRGITIKSAVVSFDLDDVTVNLIDTPGHPDFIAEVERVLSVLDGAVLVISAVEGVQPQTRILMRALQRLHVPTLLFVNKIDRAGADTARVLDAIAEKLTPAIVAMGSADTLGTKAASFVPAGAADEPFVGALAELDDRLLEAYLDDGHVGYDDLRAELAARSRSGVVHPVFLGSALTGAGVDVLTGGIAELLPATAGDARAPVSGTVFKVDRGAAGEKVAYVRLFSGTVQMRDRLSFGDGREGKVTAIEVFDRGTSARRPSAAAGQIAKLWGLAEIQIGDAVGARRQSDEHHFAPPSLATVVVPRRAADGGALRVALGHLAEQDPLIDVRQDDVRRELSLSLYGEVQKEVIQATLAADFGVDVDFRETTTICIERPHATGESVEPIRSDGNPFLAGVGLRVDPGDPGSGVQYRIETELGALPFAFHRAIEETVHLTLREGLYGWDVGDCVVTLIHSGYFPRQSHAHQGFSKAMSSTAGDFRNLTPLVLMAALRQAGTTVFEPIHRFRLELPADALGPTLPALARLQAVPGVPEVRGADCLLEGDIPAAHVHQLRLELPGLTRGEGVLECAFERYQEVAGVPPARPRSDFNPLSREQYLLHVAGRFLHPGGVLADRPS
jgi:ribosomal protection tetracycline resistance protein